MNEEDVQRFHLVFDKDRGFTAYLGEHEPADPKFFETWDSGLLSLVIGDAAVPGVEDY